MLAHSHRATGVHSSRSRAPSVLVKAISTPASSPHSSHGRDVQQGAQSNIVAFDRNGKAVKPMPVDFGLRSGSGRLYEEHYGEVPQSVWDLATNNFKHELQQMRGQFRFNPYYKEYVKSNPPKTVFEKVNVAVGEAISNGLGKLDEQLERAGVLAKLEPPPELTPGQVEEFDVIRAKLDALKLDNEGVVRREQARIARTGDLHTPLVVKVPFLALCWLLDVMYNNRPIPKFWVLETVARIPYFSYISCLHLYESLGFWRAGAELRKIHFAQEWNEMHHLQIMESLGGDLQWFDRFVAEHAAVLYYWMIIGFYLVSPKVAYNFMQRVELHAADTYTEFVESNKELLASIPPPQVALSYYLGSDLYLFDEFQTGSKKAGGPRRPECNNLLNVFENIRDDELEHTATMVACQEQAIAQQLADKSKSRQ